MSAGGPPSSEWDEDPAEAAESESGDRPVRPIHYRRIRRTTRPAPPASNEAVEVETAAEPAEPATARDRLADALPLVLVAGLCLVLAFLERGSGSAGGVNRLQVWTLFAALGIVAAVAAAVSYLIDEPEPAEVTMSESNQRRTKVRPKRKSRASGVEVASPTSRRGAPERPTLRPVSEVRGPVRPDPEYLTAPLDEPEPLDAEREIDPEELLPGDAPGPREGEREEEMIHEIDGLWTDLERLRRFPRTTGAP